MGIIRDRVRQVFPWIEPILDYFDWKQRIAAIVVAISLAGWSYVISLPWPLIVTVAGMAIVTIGYALAFPAFIKLINVGVKTKPNHTIWRHRKEFRLDEAACLLADVEPVHSYSIMDGDSKAWLSLLCEAVKLKEIKRVPDIDQDRQNTLRSGEYRPDENTIITIDELRNFCNARSRKPEFLN